MFSITPERYTFYVHTRQAVFVEFLGSRRKLQIWGDFFLRHDVGQSELSQEEYRSIKLTLDHCKNTRVVAVASRTWDT